MFQILKAISTYSKSFIFQYNILFISSLTIFLVIMTISIGNI